MVIGKYHPELRNVQLTIMTILLECKHEVKEIVVRGATS